MKQTNKQKVLNECGSCKSTHHISPSLYREITFYLEQPEPEPPQRKPLSDDDFLQWLLTHQNDTHALNFATVDVFPEGGKWKLHGWVKKLKAVFEEFYGINQW